MKKWQTRAIFLLPFLFMVLFAACQSKTNAPTSPQGNVLIKAKGLVPSYSFCFSTQWGSHGSGNGQFGSPDSLGINPITGNVYVADFGNNNVQEFSSIGTYITQWGTVGTGNGQFEQPNGLYVDGNGKVYVVEDTNARVQVFTSSGTFLLKFGGPGSGNGTFNGPTGIWADLNGNIYVADAGNNLIQKFNSSGTFLLQWGGGGGGNGFFNYPNSVAVDPTGQFVYVCDGNNARIQEFTNTGTYLAQWGTSGTGNGQFLNPRGIATDCAGDVFVTDFTDQRVQAFDGSGDYITQFGSGQFINPQGIGVDLSGDVYVVDSTGAKVVKFILCGGTLSCGVPTSTATLTPTSTPTATPTVCLNCSYTVTKERQCDPQWGTIPLGGSIYSICNAGCLLTCFSMLDNTTPNVLNTFYTQQNDFSYSGGLVVSNAIAALDWSFTMSNFYNPDTVESSICSGLRVMAHVNGYSHWVDVTGQKYDPVTNRCRLTMADPNNPNTVYLDDPSITSVNQIYTINTGL